MENLLLIPRQPYLRLDVMKGSRYYTTIKIKVKVGVEYGYEELKSFARLMLPSLADKQFDVVPTDRVVFKN